MGRTPPPHEPEHADLERWPLVGRDDELALGAAALRAHGAVVLTGSAGVGKTRLAHALLDAAATDRDRVEWTAATQAAASVPLGALARLVPAGALGQGRDAALGAIVATLQEQRGDGRLLLGVDDAHRLDDASAALVHLMVAAGAASVVLTVRSGEECPDPIVALWKDGDAPLVALQPLARHETDQVVGAALAGLVDGAALHMLWESSQGNALFLRELVRDGVESGALRADDGVWRWRGHLAPGERLYDLVALRMGRLDDDERAVIEVVAVGEPLPIACMADLVDAAVVERLERRGLLATRDDALTLAHPMFGEVVRVDLPRTRLRDLHGTLADAFESRGVVTDADVLRVALWRLASGDRSRPDQFRVAARRAWVLGALDEAEALARGALEAGPDLEAGYLLGEVLSDRGRPEEAVEVWNDVEDLPGSDQIRVSLVLSRAGALLYQLDRGEEASPGLVRALETIRDGDERLRLEGALAVYASSHPSAVAFADDIAELLRGPRSRLAPSAALAAVTIATTAGRYDEAIRIADDTLADVGDDDPQPGMVRLVQMSRCWARGLRGDVLEAEAEAEREYHGVLGDDLSRGRWCLIRGMLAMLRGHARQAVDVLREGAGPLEVGDTGFLRPTRAYLAMGLALSGDATAAQVYADAERASVALDLTFGAEVARAGSWVPAGAGEVSAAVVAAPRAAELAAERSQSAFELLARHDMVRFGAAGEVVARIEELATTVDGPLAPAIAAHARAVVAGDGSALDALSATFEGLGFDLFAAEAGALAAAAHRETGSRARAAASAQRAAELAQRCQGALTPVLRSLAEGEHLTAREREVARLAASGLASKEIGARLGIATRTVDNLLGRVYAKLGVAGRLDLAEVLGE